MTPPVELAFAASAPSRASAGGVQEPWIRRGTRQPTQVVPTWRYPAQAASARVPLRRLLVNGSDLAREAPQRSRLLHIGLAVIALSAVSRRRAGRCRVWRRWGSQAPRTARRSTADPVTTQAPEAAELEAPPPGSAQQSNGESQHGSAAAAGAEASEGKESEPAPQEPAAQAEGPAEDAAASGSDPAGAAAAGAPAEGSAQAAEGSAQASSGADEKPKAAEPPKETYPPHLRAQLVTKGLKNGRFIKGELRMMKRTRFFASVQCGKEEIIISGSRALNRAIDGDTVVVERLDAQQAAEYEGAAQRLRHRVGTGGSVSEAEDVEQAMDGSSILTFSGKTKGRVVSIVKRNKKLLPGSIQPLETSRKLGLELEEGERIFFPADERYPFVVVRPAQGQAKVEEHEGQRVVVAIDVWDRFNEYPRGHWTRTIGAIGDVNVETEMILMEHNVNFEPFSEEVLACLPPEDFQPGKKDIEGRTDFTDLCVCSIDPLGCEDVDDALSCEALPNGNFRVGVHIADVTHFVKPDTPIDEEAAARATSVYLVDRRIDMLPRLLTTRVCSLRDDGYERLTFSAVFEITPEGEVLSEDFCKSVIRSRGALSYQQAQERLDGPESDTSEITMAIRRLNKLAKIFRQQRMDNGALELDTDELSFELDEETKLPTNFSRYESFETNKLIEEFMLLANQASAKRISSMYTRYSVLRCHPPPKQDAMRDLESLLACHGVDDFKYGSNKQLANSLNSISSKDDIGRLVRMLSVRCMEQAEYFCTGDVEKSKWTHYGLAMPLYTHFTSPIRRYADVLVHRFLEASLNTAPLPPSLTDKRALAEQITKLNYKNNMAQWADRSSANLHLYLYFKTRGKVEAQGVVTRVSKGGISVAVEEYGAEGLAEMKPLDWVIIQDRQTAYGRPMSKYEGMTITVFDKVMVTVEADAKDGKHRKLRMEVTRLPDAKLQSAEQSEVSEMVVP